MLHTVSRPSLLRSDRTGAAARRSRAALWSSTVLAGAFCVGNAAAADQPPVPGQPARVAKVANSGSASTLGFDALSAASGKAEEVVVRGGGLRTATGVTGTTPGGGLMPLQVAPKSRSGLTRDFIAKQSPTSNPVSMIADLPGVVYSGNDPLGTNDDQQGLSVRGLDQTEIGYLYEGIPAAPPLFLIPYTGQTADSENIQKLTLSQGSPDISTATYNAVGGELVETLRDPASKAGGLIDGTWGSFKLNRYFVRLDSGEIGHSGVRSFLSFSYRSADQWRGAGTATRFHVDGKAVKEWGEDSRTSVVLSYNRSRQYYLRQPTLAQWNTYHTDFNYDATYTPGNANYYKFEENARSQLIVGLPSDVRLRNDLTLSVVPWIVYVNGYDNFGTNLSRSGAFYGNQKAGTLDTPSNNPSGTVTAVAIDSYRQSNPGVNASLTWKRGNNALTAGYWYSYFDYAGPSSYAAADGSGGISNMEGQYAIKTASGQTLRSYDMHLVQQANAVYVGETYRAFDDRLTLSAGVKGVFLTRTVSNILPGARFQDGASDAQPLPQVLVSYQLSPHDQIYTNGTASFRAPSGVSGYTDRFSISTGKQTRSGVTGLASEFAIGEEIGYRHTGLVNVSLALFNYNFTNRQISTTAVYNGAVVTESLNGGGQTARGAQIELGLKPWHGFSPYASGQYLHATIDNNLRSGLDYLPTEGKTAIKSPEFTGAVGLSYDNGHVFGLFTGNYVGAQYTTFMNDEKIPSYETFNLSLGYRLPTMGVAKHPQIQLNLVNIGNNGYLSGVSSVTSNAKATRGVFGTTIAAAAPTYYVGGGFAGIVSVAAGF